MNQVLVVSLREVLEQAATFSGWLYLPEQRPWCLSTQGIFIKEDKNADPSDCFPPAIFDACRLAETLDAAGVEDVISNAKAQTALLTTEDLLKAFVFYVDNDAFMEF